ncbi:hypothetical protein GCM10023260_07030 [Bartonella acomydis]|uniref:Uncharacterized protein n=1 Tax=Bartonella acomydis TaxID=686234 RepID=A0ABP9MIS5_9HYPH
MKEFESVKKVMQEVRDSEKEINLYYKRGCLFADRVMFFSIIQVYRYVKMIKNLYGSTTF